MEKAGLVRPAFSEFGSGPTGGPETMTTSNLNVAHSSDGVSSQLNLPTALGLVRPRRERTDADKAWHSEQVKVQIQNANYREVWRQMVFLAGCNPGRLCFAAHSTIAHKAGTDKKAISTKTVQRAIKYLMGEGLIRCIAVGSGRSTGKYQILGRSKSLASVPKESMQHGQKVHQIEEGIEQVTKREDPSLTTDTVKSIDPALVEEVEKQIGIDCLSFPSPEPSADGEYQHPKQVGMLCAVARKLGREVSEPEARAFDRLSHERKILTLKPLLEAEQSLAAEGVVAPPPKAELSPRHEIAHHHEGKSTSRPSCSEHQWTPAASDGVQNCYGCDAEKTQD